MRGTTNPIEGEFAAWDPASPEAFTALAGTRFVRAEGNVAVFLGNHHISFGDDPDYVGTVCGLENLLLDGEFEIVGRTIFHAGSVDQPKMLTLKFCFGHGAIASRAWLVGDNRFAPDFYVGRKGSEMDLDAVGIAGWKARWLKANSVDLHIDDDAGAIFNRMELPNHCLLLKTRADWPEKF